MTATVVGEPQGLAWQECAGARSGGSHANNRETDQDAGSAAAAQAWAAVPPSPGERTACADEEKAAWLSLDAPASDRLRQSMDALHWIDVSSVPLVIDRASDALTAVEKRAGVRCVGDRARQWRAGDYAGKPYAGLDLLVEEKRAHAMLDQAALLYGIARRARKGGGAPAPHADAAAALLALRADFMRSLSEEGIKDKLFSRGLAGRKYDPFVSTYARIGMVGPGVLNRLKSETEIFHNGRTLSSVQGKNADDLAQTRYVRLFLKDYWGILDIGENASRIVRDWLDEHKLSTDFPFGTGRHAIASVMRAVAGRQFAQSEQTALLAAFSSLALEEAALGGIPPSIRQAARHLAEARGRRAAADDAPYAVVKAEVDVLMDSLRAEMGPFPLQFTERAAALDILADATGLAAAALCRPEDDAEGRKGAARQRVVVSVGGSGLRIRQAGPRPSILDRFMLQASMGADYSAYD
jgi:hypothetical protein